MRWTCPLRCPLTPRVRLSLPANTGRKELSTRSRPNKFSNRFFLIIPRATVKPGSIRPAPRDLLAWQKPRPRSPSADVGNWNHRHLNWTSLLQTIQVWNSGSSGFNMHFENICPRYLLSNEIILYNLYYNCLLWVNHWGIQTWKVEAAENRLPGLPFWTIRASTSFRLGTSANHWLIRSCLLLWPFETDSYLMHHHNNETRRILESCKTTVFASASLSQSMVWIRGNTSNCVP